MDDIDVQSTPSARLAFGLHNPACLASFVSAQPAKLRGKPVKRVFDIVASSMLLVMLLPLLLCLVFAVLANRDWGTILYRQKRIGRGGQVSSCLKFRTMCVNADQVLRDLLATDPVAKTEWDESCKLQSDPRITRIGRFLRLCSLDEISQLWNVLVGI